VSRSSPTSTATCRRFKRRLRASRSFRSNGYEPRSHSWGNSDPRLRYPLIEGEILRKRKPVIVKDQDDAVPTRSAYAAIRGWREHVAAPIMLERQPIGFFHGDRKGSPRSLHPLIRDGLGEFAQGFAHVVERAILRQRLRVQRQELRRVARWADARTSELSNRAITLAGDDAVAREEEPYSPPAGAEGQLGDLLTRRELDVLELMADGRTNADIARTLVVTQGTVKFHVKNILRKMQASNRADATSRYLRLALSAKGPRARFTSTDAASRAGSPIDR